MTEELLGQNNLQSEGVEPTPNEPQAATPESTLPTTDVTPDAVEPSDDEGIGASEMDADLESADEGSGEMTQDEDKSKAESDKRRKSGYKRGEIFETTLLEVSPMSVIVELDARGEGFVGLIPSRELERMNKGSLEELKVGGKIYVYVVNTGDNRGNVILSYNRAQEELDWHNAEQHRKDRSVYDGYIAGYNKGGLIVRFGRLRGFVPQSQISEDRKVRLGGDTPEDLWSQMVKESIAVKVIEVDRARNRLILSERAAARETRESRKARLIEELKLNEVRTGRVVSLEDFGAFVDIGGAEGLIHLTELSWGHVTHPKQLLKVGEEVQVEIINIDPDAKRIGLSLKSQLSDPWDVVASNYTQGQLVMAEITKMTKFGVFAQLVDAPEVEGLIHISELSEQRVTHPKEVIKIGDKVTLRIVKIDVAERRLGLSLKKVNSTEYLDSDMDFMYGAS